ncbi:MAG TPA: hypothetical protein V6C88_13615 [Chroococcidiopsis sp.]
MTAPIVPATLKSTGIAGVMMPTLKVRLWFAIASALFSLTEVVLPFVYAPLEPLDAIVASLALLINLITLVMALIWIYRLHVDLRQLYPDYPITPGGALARFMIPFYNIWGIWNTLMTIAGRFKTEDDIIQAAGNRVKANVPIFYAVSITSNILNRITLQQTLENPESVSAVLVLITTLVDVGLSYILIEIARAAIAGINQKATMPSPSPTDSPS